MKVGTLIAELSLETSGFKRGMTEAQKESARLKGELELISVGGALAAASIAAIGTEAVLAAKRAGDYADQIKDVAAVTGMSTEQVQRWKYAADQSGVSFDALTTTMKMLTQNIGGVDDKNSELRKSLDGLGVSAKDANGNFRSTNDLMLSTLTALQKMDDPVKRNTLAMQLYGRSWSELADFMEDDVQLSELMAKAKPIDKYHLDQADAYKKKMSTLGSEFDQIQVKIGTKLIPAFSAITDWISSSGVPAIEWFIEKVTVGFNNMIVLQKRMLDIASFVTTGKYGTAEEEYNKKIADEVRAMNASASTAGVDMSSGVSSVSQSGGYLSTNVANFQAEMRARLGGSSGGVETGGARSAGLSTYSGGEISTSDWRKDYGSINPASAISTSSGGGGVSGNFGMGFEALLNSLKNVNQADLSNPVKSFLAQWKQRESQAAYQQSQKDNIRRIINHGTEAEKLKLLGAYNNMGYEEILAAQTGPGLSTDYTQGDYNQYYGMMSNEMSRLTSGEKPKYDMGGNAVVYVTIDGKEVAEAVFKKLQLLGVKT